MWYQDFWVVVRICRSGIAARRAAQHRRFHCSLASVDPNDGFLRSKSNSTCLASHGPAPTTFTIDNHVNFGNRSRHWEFEPTTIFAPLMIARKHGFVQFSIMNPLLYINLNASQAALVSGYVGRLKWLDLKLSAEGLGL